MTASFARTIRAAVAGAGNCASSVVQGIAYCRALGDASAFLFKHPPAQIDLAEGHDCLLSFAGDGAA